MKVSMMDALIITREIRPVIPMDPLVTLSVAPFLVLDFASKDEVLSFYLASADLSLCDNFPSFFCAPRIFST